MRVLLWYRNDLRFQDHPAIYEAAMNGYEVLPIYIYEPPISTEFPYYLGEPSLYRKDFLLESLLDLKNSWEKQGSELLVLSGSAFDIIPMLCRKYGISMVMGSYEYAPYETTQEHELSTILEKGSIHMKLFHSGLLINPDDLPFPKDQLPDIFSIFRKMVESHTEYLAPLLLSKPINSFKHEEKSIDIEPSTDRVKADIQFVGGETSGTQRVQQYLWESNLVASYKETRNGMLGMDYSSKFSPWLALGCISARQIVEELKRYEQERVANESTYWLVFELLWRDYFKFVMLKYGRKIFLKNGIKARAGKGKLDLSKFDMWKEGKTENDFINANMIELKMTGFMSNRGRQNVASYLVHDMQVDWRLGAAYFEQMLIDYDVCSNWGNWAYVAGVGNDPRENRKFNLERQAQMYDPKGEFVKTWLNL